MATIRVAFYTAFHTPSVSNVNYFLYNNTTDTSLIDNTGSSTGLSLQIPIALSQLNNSSYAGGDLWGIEEDIIQGSGVYISSTNKTLVVSGTDTITAIELWGASSTDDADRVTRFTHNSQQVTHDARNYGSTEDIVALPSLGALPITIAMQSDAASFGYITYMEITTAAAGGSNSLLLMGVG